MATTPSFQLQIPSLTFKSESDGTLVLYDNQKRLRQMVVPSLGLFAPIIDGKETDLRFSSFEPLGDTRVDLHFDSDRLHFFTLHLEALGGEDAFDLSCSFQMKEAGQLNQIQFFPKETVCNFNNLINYRNRHFTKETWPELLVDSDKGFKTDTYSNDWQFAPHPTLFIFSKHEFHLFFGAFDLPRAFGMYLEMADRRAKSWYLDYGEQPYGQLLAEGEKFTSPRFRLFGRTGQTVEGLLDLFAAMLIRGGQIPDPANKIRHSWWREPLYCTWIDQCCLSAVSVPADLKEQAAQSEQISGSVRVLTDGMVRRAVEVIERERLPFRTILIDGGWAATGEWEPDSERFPRFRELVDFLHGKGFKVVVWWNWAEIDPAVNVHPSELIGGGKLNRHGARMRDYSHPATQDYLRKLFRKLFSSDEGCYDLDGVKTDYLADKVHADMPVSDPEWRGEENYFLQVSRLFYTELKRHKPDGIHIGCAGNFWLAEFIDINRTYDTAGTNYLQHDTRSRMLRHTSPGCPVAYDFHNYLENLDAYFVSAHANGASVQIGNVLLVQPDPLTKAELPADSYYALLRRALPFQSLT